MVEEIRKNEAFYKRIEEIILKHLKRLNRIAANETVARVQSYLGGLKVILGDSSDGKKTLFLELGNQSSALFVYKTAEFLKDLSKLCGDKIDTLVVTETKVDIRNKEQCLARVYFAFEGKSLAEWIKGDGSGLHIDVTTTKPRHSAGECDEIVKVLHLTKLDDGTSTLAIELPELVDLFRYAMEKNFSKPLIKWLRDEMHTSNITMEAHQESFLFLMNEFISRIVNREDTPS